MDPEDHLEILSDSKLTIDELIKRLRDYEDTRWIGINNRKVLQATAAQIRKRIKQTIFTKVKGHSGIKGNEKADELAKQGAQMHNDTQMNALLVRKRDNQVQGAKLCMVSQAILYRGILERITLHKEKHNDQPRQNKVGLKRPKWRPTNK